MSSMQEQIDLLVSGFVHQGLQSTSSVPVQTISEIISITLSFINDNHSPHNHESHYKWCIDQETISKIFDLHKNSNNNQQITITSPQFTINQITWQLIALPSNGFLKMSLIPLKLPSPWSKIVISALLYCSELSSGDRSIFIFEKQSSYTPQRWRKGFLSMSDIKNATEIKLTIKIQTLQIISNNILWQNTKHSRNDMFCGVQKFKWRIPKLLLKQMQQRTDQKCFISASYCDMWCLRVYPKGVFNPNEMMVELQWMGIPPQLMNYAVHWTIHCQGADIKTEHINTFGYKISSAHWGRNVIASEEFKLYQQFTFCVNIKFIPQQQQQQKLINAPPYVPSAEIDISNKNESITSDIQQFVNNKFITLAQNMNTTLNNLEQKRVMDMQATCKHFNTAILSLQQQLKASVQLVTMQQEKEIKQLKQQVTMQQKHITQIYQVIHQKSQEKNKHKEISDYSIVRDWLEQTVKLPQYMDRFIDNGYDDLDLIMGIQNDDLKDIGIDKYGHRKHIIKHIAKLVNNCKVDDVPQEGITDELKLDNDNDTLDDHSQLSYEELSTMRVYKRNSVYVQNIPKTFCNEKTLRTNKWFSRFGEISSIYCNCDVSKSHITGTATIDFIKEEDAAKAIHYMNGRLIGSGVRPITLKAKHASSKYCVYFLRGMRCTNPLCRYVHQWENSQNTDNDRINVQLENRWEVNAWLNDNNINKNSDKDTEGEEEYDVQQNVEKKEESEEISKKEEETQNSKEINKNRCSNCGNYNFTSSTKCLLCGALQ